MKKILGSLLLAFLIVAPIGASSALASVGVGIGAGKITLNEALKPGGVYELPTVPVINTGDETANYGVSVEYNQVQPQLKPDASWFAFSPATFRLDPGRSQVVKVSLAIPVKTIPGEYFVYLEAHPVKIDVAGVTSIGVAAASRLYFTVAPANFLQGVYYRVKSLIELGAPWTYIFFGLVVLFILVKIFRKYFRFNIAIKAKK